MYTIKSADELKELYETKFPKSRYFDKTTMKFFGDRMSNYGIRVTTVKTYWNEEDIPVYELFRKRAVKHGLKDSSYFNIQTLEIVTKRHEVKSHV